MAKRLAAFLLVCLGTLLCLSKSASALNLSNTGDMWIDSIQYERGIYGNQNWSLNTVSPPSNTNQLQWSFSINNMNAGNEISRLFIKYKSEPSGPALISFDISYYITSPNSAFAPIYNGLKFKNRYVLLNDSCINSVGVPMVVGTNNVYTFECSYLLYSSSTTSKSIDTEAGSPIFSAAGTNNSLTMRIGPANYVEISNNGLSSDDRTWLEAHLPAGTSTADIEQAVEDAQSSHDDEQQQKYEDQADENEDTANDNSSAAQGTATTLLSVVGQFISTLTSAQPTNCNLNGNLIPHLPLGNLNLCQNSPPAAITALGSLLLIAFVVPLAYHTVKRMLALIGSFQS